MAALIYVFDRAGFVPLILLTVLAHELGHFSMIHLLGGRVTGLQLGLVGLRMDYESASISYPGEIAIALMGPFVSLALAFSASLFGQITASETAHLLAGLSLGACLFNLLPIYQLDGGRALFCLLAWRGNLQLAERAICVFSCIFIFALLLAGFGLFLYSGWNFTMLTAAVWLLISYCKSRRNTVKCV